MNKALDHKSVILSTSDMKLVYNIATKISGSFRTKDIIIHY
jgi:hypothetical protein